MKAEELAEIVRRSMASAKDVAGEDRDAMWREAVKAADHCAQDRAHYGLEPSADCPRCAPLHSLLEGK